MKVNEIMKENIHSATDKPGQRSTTSQPYYAPGLSF